MITLGRCRAGRSQSATALEEIQPGVLGSVLAPTRPENGPDTKNYIVALNHTSSGLPAWLPSVRQVQLDTCALADTATQNCHSSSITAASGLRQPNLAQNKLLGLQPK